MAPRKKPASKTAAAKKAVKEGRETVTEAEAGVQNNETGNDELRTGLATGSNASNPDQPDGHVTQTTVEPLNPDEDSTAANTVVLTDEGKEGPAA